MILRGFIFETVELWLVVPNLISLKKFKIAIIYYIYFLASLPTNGLVIDNYVTTTLKDSVVWYKIIIATPYSRTLRYFK